MERKKLIQLLVFENKYFVNIDYNIKHKINLVFDPKCHSLKKIKWLVTYNF